MVLEQHLGQHKKKTQGKSHMAIQKLTQHRDVNVKGKTRKLTGKDIQDLELT